MKFGHVCQGEGSIIATNNKKLNWLMNSLLPLSPGNHPQKGRRFKNFKNKKREAERALILLAFEKIKGNKGQAAFHLGMPRSTLY